MPVLKMLLFPVIAALVMLAGYKAYVYFNDKINGSRTLLALVFFALSLIAINIALIIGGMLLLVYVYQWLS